jgi:hypothetical protein
MEGEQVTVPKLKIIACKHPDAVDGNKGPKSGSNPSPTKGEKADGKE